MTAQIVVAFRMPLAGLRRSIAGDYLRRARSLYARGEALGARLVAWGAGIIALSWDADSMEEALALATGVRDEAVPTERAWACAIAEGELEPFSPDDTRLHLSWGEPLLAAMSLVRIAKPGEVLVDGDVRAVRASELAVAGTRTGTDGGRRLRAFVLRRAPGAEAAEVESPGPAASPPPRGGECADVLQLVDSSDGPASEVRRDASSLPARIRELAMSGSKAELMAGLPSLRGSDADLSAESPAVRCKATLAFGVALSAAGRADEAMQQAIRALVFARDAGNDRALAACFALLAKLHARAGWADAAARFRELALESADGGQADAADATDSSGTLPFGDAHGVDAAHGTGAADADDELADSAPPIKPPGSGSVSNGGS